MRLTHETLRINSAQGEAIVVRPGMVELEPHDFSWDAPGLEAFLRVWCVTGGRPFNIWPLWMVIWAFQPFIEKQS